MSLDIFPVVFFVIYEEYCTFAYKKRGCLRVFDLKWALHLWLFIQETNEFYINDEEKVCSPDGLHAFLLFAQHEHSLTGASP